MKVLRGPEGKEVEHDCGALLLVELEDVADPHFSRTNGIGNKVEYFQCEPQRFRCPVCGNIGYLKTDNLFASSILIEASERLYGLHAQSREGHPRRLNNPSQGST